MAAAPRDVPRARSSEARLACGHGRRRCRRRLGRRWRHEALLLAAVSAAADGAQPPASVARRGEAIAVGRFLDCWDPAAGLTHENCCYRGAGCFDGFYTEERCCHPDNAAEPSAETVGCLRELRSSLLACIDAGCDADGRAVCNELIETPRCAAHCGGTLPAGNGSTVTRSSELGRGLWCLARRPEVRAALDLFLAEGDGSTTLLLHGLGRSSPEARPGLLLGFEREPEAFGQAARWLRGQSSAEVTELRLSGQEGPTELAAMAQEVAAALEQRRALPASQAGTTALLVEGMPYPDGGLAAAVRLSQAERFSALRALCQVLPVDLVFLDPDHAAVDAEFAAIELYCRPLRWVVVNNINLPGFAGWVREHLLSRPGWAEVLAGRTSDPWGAGSGAWLADVYRTRAWTVLGRTGELCSAA